MDIQHHTKTTTPSVEDEHKTPSPKIEKRSIKESGSSAGGLEERSNKFADDLFSDAVTEFSDSGISPATAERFVDTTKLLDSPMKVRESDDDLEVFETPEMHTKDAVKPSDPLVEDRDGSHKDKFIEVSDKDQGEEEAVYVLSVPSDIPLVDQAEPLIDDFKDHGTVYSKVPLILGLDEKDAENGSMVTLEVKTVKEKVPESQTSENGERQETAGAEKASEEINQEKLESGHEHAAEVIKKAEIDHSVPVFTEEENVKEPISGIEADSKDSGNVGISQRSELMTSQECGVDVSIGSSSRNSLEGNWGSVSVLSTASVDAENAYKSRLGKSDGFEGPKEEIVDQKVSETKAVAVQNSQPQKSEANVSEGRKRNEEAIAKVTNWSTGEHATTPILNNMVCEANSSNPKQLSTMIQKDEVDEKSIEPGKSNLTLETSAVNQESTPPIYIGEGKKARKKKGRASWVPFVCCSSVNVS